MGIDVRQKEGVVIVKPGGNLYGPAALELKKAFDEQLANISETPLFLVDFADVTMMGSSGLGALVGAYTEIESKGGFIAIMNVDENIENLFIRSRLFDTFEHFNNEEEAIEALTAE